VYAKPGELKQLTPLQPSHHQPLALTAACTHFLSGHIRKVSVSTMLVTTATRTRCVRTCEPCGMAYCVKIKKRQYISDYRRSLSATASDPPSFAYATPARRLALDLQCLCGSHVWCCRCCSVTGQTKVVPCSRGFASASQLFRQHVKCSSQHRVRDYLTRVHGSFTAAEPLSDCGTRILHWNMLRCPTSSFDSHMHRSRILQATAGQPQHVNSILAGWRICYPCASRVWLVV
jgi:hypothetical protein